MSKGMAGLRAEWLALKSIRADMLKEAHIRAEAATAERRAAFVARVAGLVRRGEKKSVICREAGISRSTLDALLKEVGIKGAQTYSFEVGFGRNVTLVGVLTETGGFPELEGEQKIRFRIHDGIATADDVGGAARDFLDATYGPEAHAYAVQERVKGWDDPVPPKGEAETW